MNGFKFFACMPDGRKSKSASIKHPMAWTRATMRYHADRDAATRTGHGLPTISHPSWRKPIRSLIVSAFCARATPKIGFEHAQIHP